MRRPGRRPRPHPAACVPRARAFTLLEILVVIVIIGVMTTLGVLSMGTLGQDRELDSEVDRYTDVVAAATEQAVLEGRDFGVHFTPEGYEVYTYSAERQRWETLADDRLYAAHEFPAGLSVALEIEGRQLQLGRERPDAPKTPQVLLFASGDVTPYVLTLAREDADRRVRITGAPDGTLEVVRPEQAP